MADLPNLVTFSGLLAGLGATGFAAQSRFGPALALALLAILIDQLDGRLALARPQRSAAVQAFGAHLDCYADFVSKGIFPALMLLEIDGFGPGAWAVAGIHLATIAFRYSYEFVPGARARGISPDYSLLLFALLFLITPLRQAAGFPSLLGGAMLTMAALNLAPFRIQKLAGPGLAFFVALSLGLIALLIRIS